MTNPEKIKQILLSEIPFDTLLHFQISMESGSVNHELDIGII